jgi:hypothetical protein
MNRLDKDVERLLEEYRVKISAAYASTEQVKQSQPKLNEREAILLEASSIHLIPVSVYLVMFLDYWKRILFK